MKAIAFNLPGSPEVLKVVEVTAPTIQNDPTIQNETEILVRLRAAGVNPIDMKLRQRGVLKSDHDLHILGCDGAGIVEAIGTKVQKFQVGDEVYFCNGGLGGLNGNYAELGPQWKLCRISSYR